MNGFDTSPMFHKERFDPEECRFESFRPDKQRELQNAQEIAGTDRINGDHILRLKKCTVKVLSIVMMEVSTMLFFRGFTQIISVHLIWS